jgi:acyl-coenzyme A synthetase/AMP-(fatty) acid ligase
VIWQKKDADGYFWFIGRAEEDKNTRGNASK